MKPFAVITGDLEHSRRYAGNDLQMVLQRLEQLLISIKGRYGCDFVMFRGDSFQMAIPDVTVSAEICLSIRLWLKNANKPLTADARLAVGMGVGKITYPIEQSNSEAFILSGQGLDHMKPAKLAWFCSDDQFQQRTQLLTRFADAHLSQLTARQSMVLWHYLAATDKAHQSLADQLSTSRVNITQVLNAAGYDLIESYQAHMQHELARWASHD
ncbi:hypothetical protein [Shewanella sp. NIFS-20-20]|uniref:hypothetical protein n=1 Tax=Shewanella sp. NIFS-20-20 TaxID=2853806 RepID=UPI001C45FC24|nr:hypothetical protein [Shewanella sp. NIFS-20-20]MBV7315247.1 hypothetical protein [Shewanella sp. NIFS-20-20]